MSVGWREVTYYILTTYFVSFFGRLECAFVAHFVFLRDVWIRTQRAAVASRRATNLATRFPYHISHSSPCLASHLPYVAKMFTI